MNINEIAGDLMKIVKTSQFLSENNQDRLKALGPQKVAAIKSHLDGNPVGSEMNHYKIAYIMGKKFFVKEAEAALMWKGISDLKKLAENDSHLWRNIALGAAGLGVLGAGAYALKNPGAVKNLIQKAKDLPSNARASDVGVHKSMDYGGSRAPRVHRDMARQFSKRRAAHRQS